MNNDFFEKINELAIGGTPQAEWEQRIVNCCRRAIQEERAGLPFTVVRD